MNKQITVSLLNIDEAAMTIEVLDKLAALSSEGWQLQLILVDNGSQPGQLRLLQDWNFANKGRFEELLFIASSRNLGCTGGRNLAFKLASKDRLLILDRSEEHTSELQSLAYLVCRLLLEKKKQIRQRALGSGQS